MKRRYRTRTRCRYFHGGEYGYSLCSLGLTNRIFIDSDCNGVCNCYEERRKPKKKEEAKK